MMDPDRQLFKIVYERFAAKSPPTLMLQIIAERAFSAAAIEAVFAAAAERQYTRDLLFSTVFDLMLLVVTGARSSVNRAWQHAKTEVGVSLKATYDKLAGIEPGVSQAVVHHTAARCGELVMAMGGTLPPRFPGIPLRIVDGMHIEATEHRLKVLRDVHAGPRPGFALAVFDADTGLVRHALFEPDAHAQERARSDDLLALVQPGECWMGDRNFCTQRLIGGLLTRGAHPLIREHAHFPYDVLAPAEPVGRCRTGEVWQQRIRVFDPDTDPTRSWDVWRVSVHLDQPTRDGDTRIHLITDLLDHGVTALDCAEAYRDRWTIEAAFGDMATALHAEINALGYPPAALFGLAVGFCAYNLLATLRAALRSVQTDEPLASELSLFAVVEEARGAWRGLTVMLATELWAGYHDMPLADLATELKDLARHLSLDHGYRKAKRGPKKPRTPRTRFTDVPHIATHRLLNERARGRS